MSVSAASLASYVVQAPNAGALGVTNVTAYVVVAMGVPDYVPPSRRRRRVVINR